VARLTRAPRHGGGLRSVASTGWSVTSGRGTSKRSLSALTAAGARWSPRPRSFFEHDSASFGNKMMWIPGRARPGRCGRGGWAGFFSRRMAKDRAASSPRPRSSRTGCRAPTLHAPGHLPEARRLGQHTVQTWRWGPPLLAPLLVTMVGGIWACWPRSCGVSSEPAASPPAPCPGRPHGRPGGWPGAFSFPGFDVMSQLQHWDPATAAAVGSRLGDPARHRVSFSPGRGGHRHRSPRPDPRPGRGTAGAGDRDDRRAAGRGPDRRVALRRTCRRTGRPWREHARLPGRRTPKSSTGAGFRRLPARRSGGR